MLRRWIPTTRESTKPFVADRRGAFPRADRGPFTARLPSSDAAPAARLVVLWCLLVEGARKSARAPLQVLFATEEPDAGITILHRDLRSDDIFALHPEMPGYEYIADLRRLDLSGNPEVSPLSEAQEARPVAALLEKDFDGP